MNPFFERDLRLTRRQLFGRTAQGLGSIALMSLLGETAFADQGPQKGLPGLKGVPHFKPKAKRVIVLWQGGAPSQVDLFDPKPNLEKMRLEELPESIRKTSRLSTMTSSQGKYPIL